MNFSRFLQHKIEANVPAKEGEIELREDCARQLPASAKSYHIWALNLMLIKKIIYFASLAKDEHIN